MFSLDLINTICVGDMSLQHCVIMLHYHENLVYLHIPRLEITNQDVTLLGGLKSAPIGLANNLEGQVLKIGVSSFNSRL